MNQKEKSYGQALITAVIIILIIASTPFLNDYLNKSKKEFPEPKQIYAIENISPEFESIWTKNSFSVPLPEHDGSAFMVADFEQAYILAKDGSVIALNLQNGEEDQIVRMPYKAIPVPFASTIAMNSEMLYIGFDKTQKIEGNMRWGAGKIEARDRVSGTQKWSQAIPGAAYFDQLIITEDKINVDGFSSNKYHLLDAKTGEILQSDSKLDDSFIWQIEEDLAYERTKDSSFQLKNQVNEKILWQSEFFSVSQPPRFTNNRIIFKSGARVIALNKINGQIAWEYPQSGLRDHLYSNIAMIKNAVFFVTESGTLFAVDAESGNTFGSIQFSPAPTQESYYDTFQVTAGKDIVLVHTGSSKQLFAFHFTMP